MSYDYATANDRLGKRESLKIANNTRLERRPDGTIAIRLHATDVVTFTSADDVILNSGGWQTVTTKQRMNEWQARVRVASERGVWLVNQPCAHGYAWGRCGTEGCSVRTVAFADGMKVTKRGRIVGAGPDPSVTTKKRKRIAAFARAYMNALEAGKVPAPGAGDCLYCQWREVKTGAPLGEMIGDRTDHLRSHLAEKYFVPSLLARALEVGGASMRMKWWVGSFWDTTATQEERDGARRFSERARVEKALRRYLLLQFGLAR